MQTIEVDSVSNETHINKKLARQTFDHYMGRVVTIVTYAKWLKDIAYMFNHDHKIMSLHFLKLLCSAAQIRNEEYIKAGDDFHGLRHDRTLILERYKQITSSEIMTFIFNLTALDPENTTEYQGKDFPAYFRAIGFKVHANSFYLWSKLNPDLPEFKNGRMYSKEDFNQWRRFIESKPGRHKFQSKTEVVK